MYIMYICMHACIIDFLIYISATEISSCKNPVVIKLRNNGVCHWQGSISD